MRRTKGLQFGRRRRKVNIPLVKEIFAWAFEIALVIAIAVVCVHFLGQRTTIVGNSMSETFEEGEQILINTFLYTVTDPKPNDIVVFLPNGNEKSHYYVKRVVAVPGDKVQILDGALYVNGALFEEKIDTSSMDYAGLAEEEITLGKDEYFVLGDNRNNSEDSRYANIGNVKKEYIIGKAWFVLSPLSEVGIIH